jgi:hypothetical protein
MKFFVPYILISLGSLHGYAQFKNEKISEAGLQPSVIVNHDDANNIIVAPGTDLIVHTQDGGLTWGDTRLETPVDVMGGGGLRSSARGIIEYFYLTGSDGADKKPDRIRFQSSSDNGKNWTTGISTGNNPPKTLSSPQSAIDPLKNPICLVWTQVDQAGSTDAACQSNILFSQSANGKKWSTPIRLNELSGDCLDQEDAVQCPIPITDGEKKIFVIWSNKGNVYMDRSYNEGDTWLTGDMLIHKDLGPWLLEVPGIKKSTRMPVIAIDNSHSFFRNTLYMVWADQRKGKNDTDIWFSRSIKRGDLWTEPIRINKDPVGKHQFMPWLSVDPMTGVIYIVYYDRRNYDDLRTDVYLAYSTDGGDKFKEVKVSEKPFTPTAEVPFAEYTSLSSFNGIIAPAWVRMDDGKTSVWATVVRQDSIFRKEDLPKIQVTQKKQAAKLRRPIGNDPGRAVQRPRRY